jgi:hypothetical protein
MQPQVNLLPPEIRSRRDLGRVKVRLGIGLILLVLVLLTAFGYSILAERTASGELQAVQDEVADLQAEQARYAEVPLVKSQIASALAARELAMSTEVLWSDYLRAIQTVAPDGWVLRTLTTAMPTPVTLPVGPANPWGEPSVGSLSFTGRAMTLPDIAAWADALESIPGFSDAYFTSAEITDEKGIVFYDVSSTVQVDAQVFALRFIIEEGE